MVGRRSIILNQKSGKLLSECIQSALKETTKRENKRLAKSISNIYIVENVEIPLSIVECGFLSNPEEASLLTDDSYQDKLAYGIFLGIGDYFEK